MQTERKLNPALVWLSLLPLVGWWIYGLFDLDEGYYAAVVSEMNRRSEWITPFYNGKPWFEKPILLYWAAKPCVAIFGEMIGPRMPSVLATLGIYALVGWFAKKRLGQDRVVPAVLILGSSLVVVLAGRMMLTDPLLVLSLTAAFITYWESIAGDWRWRWVTAVALGFAVLAKGPVALALFVPIAGLTAWRFPELRSRMTQGWAVGTLLLVLVISCWYVPAYLVNGHEFVQRFLIEQNVGRFTGGDSAHTITGIGGLLFYVVILLVGMAPWSVHIPSAFRFSRDEPLAFYLKTWALTVFIFFTISGAKLPHYILPACPALALLLADEFAFRKRSVAVLVGWTVFIAVLANGAFIWWYQASGQEEIHRLARFVKAHAAPGDVFAEYEMGRQSKDMGTLKSKIQETAEPSILLYLDHTAIDSDDWQDIIHQKNLVWLMTRPGRIQQKERDLVGSRLHEFPTGLPSDNYVLYQLDPEKG